MAEKCKKCPMHEKCICIPSADECFARKQSFRIAIDEFAKRLKENSIRGAFEYKPNKKEPWHKVRAFCRVVGTRKIDEIAAKMKVGAE